MSKGSLFWANASGKLGETVLYRAGGEQRTRSYVKKIKNPKTLAQMSNRIQMINLNSVYKSLKPILEASFPNKKSNQSGWNAFVQANKSVQTAVVTKEGAERGLAVPYNMLLSKGNLPLIQAPAVADVTLGNGGAMKNLFIVLPQSANIEGLNLSTSEGFVALLTALGLPSTAKLTVVRATYEDEGFRFLPIEQYSKENAQNIPASLFVVGQSISGDLSGAKVFGFKGNGDEETLATFMFSYTDANGKLAVTDARMLPTNGSTELIEQFLPDGEVWLQVLNQYGFTNGSILSTQGSIAPSVPNIPNNPSDTPSDDPSDEPSDDPTGGTHPDNGGGSGSVEDIFIGTSVNDKAMGSVTGMGTYPKGSTVTLTAVPNTGYRFVEWGDGSTDNPRQVTATENGVIYSAVFEAE